MQSVFLSENAPLLRGGQTVDPAVGEGQNANAIAYNGRRIGMIKAFADVPETLWPAKLPRYNMDEDGLQPNGTLREMFDGYNAIAQGANPMIDFSTGAWSPPLDSYVNSAVRWSATTKPGGLFVGKLYRIVTTGTTDWTLAGAPTGAVGEEFVATATTVGDGTAQQIFHDGDLTAGNWYEIDIPGSSDFTAIGASDNLPGTMFQATGADTGGNGVVKATAGARHGDMAGCAWDDGTVSRQQLYINVYDDNNGNTNRLALIESDDGFASFAEIGEITFGGGNFGATVADVIQRPGTTTLYMICGENAGVGRGYRKITRKSTDGGRSWTNTGSRVDLSSDPASPRYYGLPVGRFIQADSERVWASLPASRLAPDWPEANIIVHASWSDLDAGVGWTIWPHDVAAVRGPTYSGLWNMDPVAIPTGERLFIANCFGRVGFGEINTPAMNTLRDGDQYHEMGAGSHKHAAVLKSVNALAIDDPGYWPFAAGDRLRLDISGRFLAAAGTAFGDNAILTGDAADPRAVWIVRREGEFFWRLDLEANPALSLATGGVGSHAGNRAIGHPFEVRTHDPALAQNNIEHHFSFALVGDYKPRAAHVISRRSSLALGADAAQHPLLHGDARLIWNIEVL